MLKLEVFILTYNRPRLLQKTLDSVLLQSYNNCRIIVSDNSTDTKTGDLLKNYSDSKFQYRKRSPSLTSKEHFSQCVQEVTAPYFMLFHDDDIMYPEMLSEIMKAFQQYPEAAAIGTACDNIDIDGDLINKYITDGNTKIRVYNNKKSFLTPYLTRRGYVVPFPSYVYKKGVIDEWLFSAKGSAGKYGDVLLLSNVLNYGVIVQLLAPMMAYRNHSGQDSKESDMYAILSLYRYVYSNTDITSHSEEFSKLRYMSWSIWLKYNRKKVLKQHPRRYFKVLRIMMPYLIANKWKAICGFFSSSDN